MTFWELAGLMCLASFLIPVVVFFCVRFKVVARHFGEQQVKREFPNGRK